MFENRELFRTLMDSLHEGVYFVDVNRVIQYWNKTAEQITGFAAGEVMGKRCADNILMHVDQLGQNLCQGQCPLAATMEDGTGREATVFLHHKDGHRMPVRVRVAAVRDDAGAIIGGLETFADASAQLAAMDELEDLKQMALICPLTGIGNRRYAERTLFQRIEEARRDGTRLAVIFADVDHFKKFNDTFGHQVGDVVLKMVGRTLSGALRASDFAGRWGGEEFVVILPRVKPGEVAGIANRLRLLVETSSRETSQGRICVTVSMGAYLCNQEDTAESAIRGADELMYRSKNEGRNRVTTNAS